MADQAVDDYSVEHADHYLEVSRDDWESVPWLEENWPEMSSTERLDNDLEWTITDEMLSSLTRWADAGCLTPEQMERYQELLKLVEKYRPTIERLREGDE